MLAAARIGLRAEQQVEGQVALEVIEQETQQSLGTKARIRPHERLARIPALAVEEIGDRVTGSEPVFERGVNATGGDR